MKKNISLVLLILFFCSVNLQAQKSQAALLYQKLSEAKHDTTRINVYNKLAALYTKTIPDSAFILTDKAFRLSEKLLQSDDKELVLFAEHSRAVSHTILGNYYKALADYFSAIANFKISIKIYSKLEEKKGLAYSYIDIGIIKSLQSDYIISENYYKMALKILREINDEAGQSKVYRNLGNVYFYEGDYPSAIDYYQKSLELSEKINDLKSASRCYNNIGYIQSQNKMYQSALEYFNNSLAIKKKIGDERGIATVFNNIGNVYFAKKDYEKALMYYNQSLEIREKVKAKRDMAFSLRNIGKVYLADKDLKKANNYYQRAIRIYKNIGDQEQTALLFSDLAFINLEKNKYISAIQYADSSLELGIKLNALPRQKDAYQQLAFAYEKLHNHGKAYSYLRKYVIVNDSITDKAAKKLIESETRYKLGKKQKEIEAQNLLISNQNIKAKNQRMTMFFTVGALIIMIIFAFILFKNYKQKARANDLLKEQKQEIEAQKEEIESQRDVVMLQKEEITASIVYAKNIQRAVMPSEETMDKMLQEYFLMFKPKDIVSGDFYWMKQIRNFLVIAVADCTGHGVPGAFMSMLGSLFLNEAVTSRSLDSTGQILNKLREKIKKSLHQTGKEGETKDGMDISFFIINTETLILQFSGAFNPLYIIRDKKLIEKEEINNIKAGLYYPKTFDSDAGIIELKGDRQPIAIYSYEKDFNSSKIQLKKGDCLYSLSDGYADQFGGKEGKKLKSRGLKDFLLNIWHEPMSKQGELIENNFDIWKGDLEQIDDVILLGLKIK